MSGFVDGLALWAVQDALLAALKLEDSLIDKGLGLGHPTDIEPEHVWIGGNARGSVTNELAGETAPSDETLSFPVFIFAQADDYLASRTKLKELGGAVERALASDGVKAVLPSWGCSDYELDSGTDGSNVQLCLQLTIEGQCW